MPTTDAAAARAVLAALGSAGVDYALLHGGERLDGPEPMSDIDIVVRIPPRAVITQARTELDEGGLAPVTLRPYDIGRTATLCVMDRRGRSGVQLDMLYDRDGIGRYHVRSGELVADPAAGKGVPSVAEADQLVYLWAKRLAKRQEGRRLAVEASLHHLGPDAVREAARRLITRDDWVGDLIGHRTSPRPHRRLATKRAALEIARLGSRLVTPIGFWAHLSRGDGEVARHVAERFGRILVYATAPRSPNARAAWWWYARQVLPIRLRPGLVISHGRRPRGVTAPHLVLEDGATDVDEIGARIMAAMSDRLGP
ncbi:MAG: hypothetical protein H0V96_03990 [Acidimicrobiia bacterium]|nr:hypothetical protein [Acidimicrobiia bacterium]